MKKLFSLFAVLFGLLAFASCSGGSNATEDVSSQYDEIAKQWLVGDANIANVYTQEICEKEGDLEKDSRWSIQLPSDVNSMIRTHVYSNLDGETKYRVNYASVRYSSTILQSNRSVITKAISDNAETINAMFNGVFAGCEVQTTWNKDYTKDETDSVYVAYLPLLVRYYNKKGATTPFLLTFVLVPIKVDNTTLPTTETPNYSSVFAENTKDLIVNWTANKDGNIKLG